MQNRGAFNRAGIETGTIVNVNRVLSGIDGRKQTTSAFNSVVYFIGWPGGSAGGLVRIRLLFLVWLLLVVAASVTWMVGVPVRLINWVITWVDRRIDRLLNDLFIF